MWKCEQCGETIADEFDECWKCADVSRATDQSRLSKSKQRLAYRIFRGTLATWDELFTDAARFATEVGRENVLNISHSAKGSDGVVTVWYWERRE